MALFEELERVKLRFITTCEKLLVKECISEDDFEQILSLLDNLDDYTEEQLNEELARLTKGRFDLSFWENR